MNRDTIFRVMSKRCRHVADATDGKNCHVSAFSAQERAKQGVLIQNKLRLAVPRAKPFGSVPDKGKPSTTKSARWPRGSQMKASLL